MASQGPLSPSSWTNDTSAGGDEWNFSLGDPGASDDAYAQNPFSGAAPTSGYLVATNFGFSIPSGATIDGIVVEVEKSVAGAGETASDLAARIVKGGVIGSTDKSAPASDWTSTEAYTTYGGASDLWGETWSVSDINASNFGFAIRVQRDSTNDTARVDHIRITVYYTESGGGSPQNVSVTGLGSAAAFGSVTAQPGGVAEEVSGLASAAGFGTVTAVPGAVAVSVTGLASAAEFGTVTAAPGGTTVEVAGLDSAASFGTVTADDSQIVPVAGLGSAAAFGTVTAAPGGTTVAVPGLDSAAQFGGVTTEGGEGPTFHPAIHGGKHR